MAQYDYGNIFPTAYPASVADSQVAANKMGLKEALNQAVASAVDKVKSNQLAQSDLGQAVGQTISNVSNEVSQRKATPEYRDKVINDFNNWKNDEQKKYNDLTYTMTSGTLANGINAFNPSYYEEQLGNLKEKTEQQDKRTGFIAAMQRATEPEDGYKIGFSTQNKTPQEAKAVYDYHFNMDDINGTNEALARDFDERTAGYQNLVQDRDYIDEGQSAASRQSPYMTGKQYKRYIEWGMGGRPVNEIVDDAIYSKQDEMDSYGFIPYIVDDKGLDNFHNTASMQAINNVYNDLANSRQALTDYTVTIDGIEHSGKDVDKNFGIWWNNISDLLKDESVYVEQPISEYDVPVTVGYYTDPDTRENFRSLKADLKIVQNEDGSVFVSDSDGIVGTGYYPSREAFDNSLEFKFADDGDFIASYAHVPPAKLDDGTLVRGDTVLKVYGNLDDYATYDALGFNKPYVDNPFEDGFVPWLYDMFTQSVPLFFNPTAAPQAAARFATNASGMKAGYDNYLTHTYSKISEDPSPDQAATNAIASLVMPLTERLWGPVGGRAISKAFNNIFRDSGKIATTADGKLARREYIRDPRLMPAGARHLWESLGEGAEEIPGNIVENLMSNAPSDFYADPVYVDQNGNVVSEDTPHAIKKTDASGNIVYDENTPPLKRLLNYLADIPLSVLGGILMGGGIAAPSAMASSSENAANWRQQLGNLIPNNYYNEQIEAIADLAKRAEDVDEESERRYIRPNEAYALTDDVYDDAETLRRYDY